MTGFELLHLMEKSHRRSLVIGTPENGIIAGLDLEGRLFAVAEGRVLNRVVPSAIELRSNKSAYQNPGGDALWPAPEGTTLGYEYSAGSWRVPPSITGAVWEVVSETPDSALIKAEIDLINNQQVGLPCEFERHVKVLRYGDKLIQDVRELIRYIGHRTLKDKEFLLAPWSLCQFDSGIESNVTLSLSDPSSLWDMYDTSEAHRSVQNGICTVNTKCKNRFQIGLGTSVPWVDFTSGKDFKVRRYTPGISPGLMYIDISDSSPDKFPSSRGVKLSVYCDPSGFTELEACGGCPRELEPGTELIVNIMTEYELNIK